MNVHDHNSSNLPNTLQSILYPCTVKHFSYLSASACFDVCVSRSSVCSLPQLFCQRLQRLFHKGPSPDLPQTQSSPQQISFTPNPGDTAAISAADSLLHQPAVRLGPAAKTHYWWGRRSHYIESYQNVGFRSLHS